MIGRRPTPEPATGIAANGLPRESVWDYPRPPRIEPCARTVRVELGGVSVAASSTAVRVLETAGAPVVYVPPADVTADLLVPARGGTFCEWKGSASYFDVAADGKRARRAAWTYAGPTPEFEAIAGWISFYPAKVECYLDDERVEPQPGRFYGGWVTAEITGPIKGSAGSLGW